MQIRLMMVGTQVGQVLREVVPAQAESHLELIGHVDLILEIEAGAVEHFFAVGVGAGYRLRELAVHGIERVKKQVFGGVERVDVGIGPEKARAEAQNEQTVLKPVIVGAHQQTMAQGAGLKR